MNPEQARQYHSNSRLGSPYSALPAGVGYVAYAPQAQAQSGHPAPPLFQTMQHSSAKSERKRPQYTRSKTGCLTCRGKKVKCDESKPYCQRCVNSHRECSWPEIATLQKKSPARRKRSSEDSPETASSSVSSPTVPVIPHVPSSANDRNLLPPIATMSSRSHQMSTADQRYENGNEYPVHKTHVSVSGQVRRHSMPMIETKPVPHDYYQDANMYHRRSSQTHAEINSLGQTHSTSYANLQQPASVDPASMRGFAYPTVPSPHHSHSHSHHQHHHHQSHRVAPYSIPSSYTPSEYDYSRPSTATSVSSVFTNSSIDNVPYDMGHYASK